MTKAQQNQRPISDVRVVGGSLRSITLNAGEDPAQNSAGGPHLATPPQVYSTQYFYPLEYVQIFYNWILFNQLGWITLKTREAPAVSCFDWKFSQLFPFTYSEVNESTKVLNVIFLVVLKHSARISFQKLSIDGSGFYPPTIHKKVKMIEKVTSWN